MVAAGVVRGTGVRGCWWRRSVILLVIRAGILIRVVAEKVVAVVPG